MEFISSEEQLQSHVLMGRAESELFYCLLIRIYCIDHRSPVAGLNKLILSSVGGGRDIAFRRQSNSDKTKSFRIEYELM